MSNTSAAAKKSRFALVATIFLALLTYNAFHLGNIKMLELLSRVNVTLPITMRLVLTPFFKMLPLILIGFAVVKEFALKKHPAATLMLNVGQLICLGLLWAVRYLFLMRPIQQLLENLG